MCIPLYAPAPWTALPLTRGLAALRDTVARLWLCGRRARTLHRFERRFDARSAAGRASARYLRACAAMLDRLRGLFPVIVAVALPLAGAVLAIVRFADGDRDEGLRLAPQRCSVRRSTPCC